MRTIRLLPLVAFAAFCLLVLKFAAFMLSDGYVLSGSAPAQAQAQPETPAKAQSPQKAGGSKDQDSPIPPTGKKIGKKQAQQEKPQEKPKSAVMPTNLGMGPEAQEGGAEFEVLRSLADRRRTLEKQEEELLLRENLLKAAEKQVEKRISELKNIERQIASTLKKKEGETKQQFTRLVKMYSNMKPARAAEIFNRLEMGVLIDLVSHMKANKMSPILAAMDLSRAEILTLEIANKNKSNQLDELDRPKVQGNNPG